jgi:hypothetical protein
VGIGRCAFVREVVDEVVNVVVNMTAVQAARVVRKHLGYPCSSDEIDLDDQY